MAMSVGVQRRGTNAECATQVGPELVYTAARAAAGGVQRRGRGAAYIGSGAAAAGPHGERRSSTQPWIALLGKCRKWVGFRAADGRM